MAYALEDGDTLILATKAFLTATSSAQDEASPAGSAALKAAAESARQQAEQSKQFRQQQQKKKREAEAETGAGEGSADALAAGASEALSQAGNLLGALGKGVGKAGAAAAEAAADRLREAREAERERAAAEALEAAAAQAEAEEEEQQAVAQAQAEAKAFYQQRGADAANEPAALEALPVEADDDVEPEDADATVTGASLPVPVSASAAIVPAEAQAVEVAVIDDAGGAIDAAQAEKAGFADSLRSALSGGGGGNMVNSQLQVNYKPTFVQGASAAETKDAKSALLAAILGLERGLAASEEKRRAVQKLACALEAANPTAKPLRSPLMNGEWELQYTTCLAAIGGNAAPGVPAIKPKAGGIKQRVDMYSLKLINETTYNFFMSDFTNVAIGDVEAQSDSRLALNFTDFKIGPLQLKAPPKTPARLAIEWELAATGRGGSGAWLDTTYLDYDMRISRNDMGDLFVLTRVD